MEYGAYIENFKNPSDEYYPAAMWFLNDDLKKEEITFQLEEFKKQGIYDLFVNAVWGLTVRYLSDEFFGFVRHAVDECKRLGLRYWIYDEFNWPSGNAGGELLRDYPWAGGRILKLVSVPCLPGHPADMTICGKFLAAHAVFGSGEDCHVEDIGDRVKVGELGEGVVRVSYSNRYCASITVNYYFSVPDPHVLTTCVWYRYAGYEAGYIDTFNRAAVDKFIELTHERYKKWVGDEFGKTVRGVFTDEVCLADPFTLGENRLPWSDCFAEKFKSLNGYDITGQLHGLLTPPVTPGQKKVREDYFNTAKLLYLENFIKPMYDWCEKNNLKFTGHFDGEESVTWHLMQSADLMVSLEYMHIPGIDSIVSAKKIGDKNFNVAGKLLASAAKYYGRPRTLCETYTGSGWDLRMPMMKRIADRLIMLGVNMLHYMGAYYSWDGFMKSGYTSYPPTHGYNNTLWGHYKKFGDYLAGMQYLSAVTTPASGILLMIPLVQAKMRLDLSKNIFEYLKGDFCLRHIDELIEGTVDACLLLHADLDLVSEDAAPEIGVCKNGMNGMIRYRGQSYRYIILPEMEHISAQTAEMAERLETAGAKVIYINHFPKYMVGREGSPAAHDPKSFRLKSKNEAAELSIGGPGGNVGFVRLLKSPLDLPGYAGILREALDEGDIMLGLETTGNVLACRRENEDIELVFINNDDGAANTVSIPERILGLNCYDPESRLPKSFCAENGFRTYELAPGEMTLAIRDKTQPQAAAGAPMAETERPAAKQTLQALTEGWTFSAANDNALPLVYMFFDERKNSYVPTAPCSLPANCPAQPGMKYTIRANFKIGGLKKITEGGAPLYFNCEVRDVCEIHVNGNKIEHCVNTRFWGVNNFKTDISALLAEGDNEITIKAALPDWPAPHALPFGFISGAFKTDENDVIVPIIDKKIALGPLEGQGYRYFTGRGSYENVFTPPDGIGYDRAYVNFDNKDILKLSVNGVYVCERMWKPYRADITGYVKKGEENSIAFELTTTYAGMFGVNTSNGLERAEIEYVAYMPW